MSSAPSHYIFLDHPLNQADGLDGLFGTTATVTGFEFPKQSKTLSMLAMERDGFEDEERISPIFHTTGEEVEPEAIGWRDGRSPSVAVRNDELLAEERIPGDEVGFTACQISNYAQGYRTAGGLGEVKKAMFKKGDQTDNPLDEQIQEAIAIEIGVRPVAEHLSEPRGRAPP